MADSYNPNKLVVLTKGGSDWKLGYDIAPNIRLYLENDVSISVNQTYEDPLKEIMEAMKSTKLGKLAADFAGVAEIGTLISGTRLMTKYVGSKAWKTSSQLDFSLSFNFYMGMAGKWEGRTEVYNPIAALGNVFLPKVTSGITIAGPGPSYADILSTQAKSILKDLTGADITNFANLQSESTAAQKTEQSTVHKVMKEMMTKNAVSVTIGKVYNFKSVLPMSFEYSFSKETDTEGYPISGSVNIKCETFQIGTSDDLPAQ